MITLTFKIGKLHWGFEFAQKPNQANKVVLERYGSDFCQKVAKKQCSMAIQQYQLSF